MTPAISHRFSDNQLGLEPVFGGFLSERRPWAEAVWKLTGELETCGADRSVATVLG